MRGGNTSARNPSLTVRLPFRIRCSRIHDQLGIGIVPGPAHADGLWKKKEQYFSRCRIENPVGFVRLLRRMMQLDPEKRPTAVELRQDPYFNGLHDEGGVPLLRDVSNLPTPVELAQDRGLIKTDGVRRAQAQ